ncbi:transmembrane prolyl 4-hydroxylase-like [Orbicella faveolata]|uniref:transmembrane prolyl 4-hydroxylase-like n=1 Tax=Orbicella faveolata TaxID=48498 RepID=UPI0009E43164|nr:transmembrane prolyl 4-hydroxylase-like [Orbicella faveolata]
MRVETILFLAAFFLCVQCRFYTDSNVDPGFKQQCKDDTCVTDERPCFIPREKGILTRLDGVKVGHRQEVDLGLEKKVLITRALKPLLFEIPNFLSEEECDHIISLASENELFKSVAKGGLTESDTWKYDPKLYGKADGPRGMYENWDFNQDGKITVNEFKQFAKIYRYLYLTDAEVKRLFDDLKLRELDDGVITHQEFQDMNTLLIDSYLYEMGRSHPRHRERFSEQTWLTQEHEDGILQDIRLRIQAITKLPDEIIYGSEYLQVVRYGVDGHYHAHLDSETHEHPDFPCCHQVPNAGTDNENKCKLCRYVTFLYFLNEPPEGGETAFPMADNATFVKENFGNLRSKEDIYNLSEFCHKANLVVRPKKGTAIMWYNHFMDPDSGWMGKMDEYSIHGGCAVRKGIKWIANNWITAPYKSRAHVPSQYILGPDIYFTED